MTDSGRDVREERATTCDPPGSLRLGRLRLRPTTSEHKKEKSRAMRAPPLRRLHLHFTSTLSLTAGRAGAARRPLQRSNRPSHLCLFNSDGRTDGRMNHLPGRQAGWLPDRLAGWLAGVCTFGDAPLMPSNRCFARSELPPPARPPPPSSLPPCLARSLARSTNREGEKKEGEKELVYQPGDGGAGALARLLIGGGGLAGGPRRRSLARSGA